MFRQKGLRDDVRPLGKLTLLKGQTVMEEVFVRFDSIPVEMQSTELNGEALFILKTLRKQGSHVEVSRSESLAVIMARHKHLDISSLGVKMKPETFDLVRAKMGELGFNPGNIVIAQDQLI